jgi:PAS domain S-box-containing protein
MNPESDDRCRELEEKLRILALENDELAERAEETLLLGLFAAKLSSVENPDDLFGEALEQIALLKDIPFVACCLLVNRTARILCSYELASAGDVGGMEVTLAAELVEKLASGSAYLEDDDCSQVVLPTSAGDEFIARRMTLIPLKDRTNRKLLFLFSSDQADGRLTNMGLLLQRIVDSLGFRLDNLLLLGELHTLNQQLDAKVMERTQDLEVANLSLRQEIQDRLKVESELRSSQERFRELFDNSFDAVFVLNGDLDILDVNRQTCTALGYSEDQLRAMSLTTLSPRGAEEWGRDLSNRLGNNRVFRWKGSMCRQNGESITVELRLRRLNLAFGEVILALAQDVSERDNLREQLNQAQKMEAVGRLAGGIAHDFNNILTAISGHVELAAMGLGADDPILEDIEAIQSASERAAGLTRQLLAFSRKQVMDMRVLDMSAMVQKIAGLLARMIGEDVELVLDLDTDLGGISADLSRIEQILMNLAVNARDAMPAGGVLTISTSRVDAEAGFPLPAEGDQNYSGSFLRLAVSDTGQGISADIRDQVFDPFFTTKDTGKGTGLGLAMVYGIARQHGGLVRMASTEGTGTTFEVFFPEAALPISEPEETGNAGNIGGTESILLVEDDPTTRTVIARILNKLGYDVFLAENGAEAIDIVQSREGPLDLLLTDVVMPGMNGPDLAKKLSAQRPELKIAFMSGYTNDYIGRNGVLESDTLFLQKPLSFTQLASSIRAALDNSSNPN